MRDTAGCLGKMGYPTRAEANKARSRVMSRPDFRGHGCMDVYCCSRCGSFHLGRDRRRGPNPARYNEAGKRVNLEKLRRYQELTK